MLGQIGSFLVVGLHMAPPQQREAAAMTPPSSAAREQEREENVRADDVEAVLDAVDDDAYPGPRRERRPGQGGQSGTWLKKALELLTKMNVEERRLV